MRMNERQKKIRAMVLCICMLMQNAPVVAFSAATENLCDHHTQHTADCGYVAAVEGVSCAHVHDEACGYTEAVEEVLCDCTETDETGNLVHMGEENN